MFCIIFDATGIILRVVFTGGSSRKGVRVPIGVPGWGVLGRVEAGGWGGIFLWKMMENGKGEGGWGGGGSMVSPAALSNISPPATSWQGVAKAVQSGQAPPPRWQRICSRRWVFSFWSLQVKSLGQSMENKSLSLQKLSGLACQGPATFIVKENLKRIIQSWIFRVALSFNAKVWGKNLWFHASKLWARKWSHHPTCLCENI